MQINIEARGFILPVKGMENENRKFNEWKKIEIEEKQRSGEGDLYNI